MRGKWAVRMVALGAAAIVAISGIIMLLWNALIPDLFRGPVISYWQAMGLLVLSHLLVRGWGHHGHGWHRDRWSHRLEEKLAAMTPEEREKFRTEWRNRCGWVPAEPDAKGQQ